MEPEVQIIEISGEGMYKLFSTGVLYKECTREEARDSLEGKLHLFLLFSSNADIKEVHQTCRYFFSSTKVESISAMYSSVAASLALGIQNTVVLSVEHSKQEGILCSIDLISKSSLVYSYSQTKCMEYNACVEAIVQQLYLPIFKEAGCIHIKGDAALKEKAMQSLAEKGVFSGKTESSNEDSLEFFNGYHKVSFPAYFKRMMPHNMLLDSNIIYVGAVLTIMINYFEIKEVNTREDFEAGITKNLLLN